MNEYVLKIENVTQRLDEKKKKKLQVKLFVRLCNKVEEEENIDINRMIQETFDLLQEYTQDESIKKSTYLKSFRELKKHVREELDFTPKGLLQEEMTGIGIAIGVAMGSAFVGINPALIGIGLPIGLAIGASIGKRKEDKAESEGKTY
jgi:hypothetical protein